MGEVLTVSNWASDLVTDAIFERHGTPVVGGLLLFELTHDMLPSRVLVKVVRFLMLNDVTHLSLLHLAKVSLLFIELIDKEPFIGCAVHVV